VRHLSKLVLKLYILTLCLFMAGGLSAQEDLVSENSTGFEFQQGFEDDEGCLLCHKYPKMARVTEAGARRSYYVMPEVYGDTVHRNVKCGDCHSYIKQLPHREVTEGVRCDAECHSVKNPATGKNFTHKKVADLYMTSDHGREKSTNGHDQDKPYCVTCHTNPVYNPNEHTPPKQILDRCVICHEDQKFVVSWYKHTGRRINEVKRTSEEIVALCTSCHGDERLVARHMKAAQEEGRELGPKYAFAVESYNESFHGKITRYGLFVAANCLDCHVEQENYYLNVHDIQPSRVARAPTNAANKLASCQRCHTFADKQYASLDPHPSSRSLTDRFRYYAEHIYEWVGNVVIVVLTGLAAFETIGRRRDGVRFRIIEGSSWRNPSRRGRDRVVADRIIRHRRRSDRPDESRR